MESEGYAIRDQYAAHYVTFQVIDWVDIFTRKFYKDILIESFIFCRKEFDLKINGYVIMSNHAHAILRSPTGNLSSNIASFKKFTSKKIHIGIQSIPESRRDWMLKRFEFGAMRNGHNSDFQLWTNGNHPKEIITRDFLLQKLNYIHDNPARAGIVEEQHHYLYSSARNYNNLPAVMDIDLIEP